MHKKQRLTFVLVPPEELQISLQTFKICLLFQSSFRLVSQITVSYTCSHPQTFIKLYEENK